MTSRRAVLRTLGRGLTAALLLACRRGKGAPSEPADSEGPSLDCGEATPDPSNAAWVSVPLADYPDLAEVGGQAAVSVPEALLQVVVAQPTEGCYFAVWRICTHGACDVAWEADSRELVCPCHGSRFGEEGEVLEGPATEPLDAFPVVREGETLWIYRPLQPG